MGVLLLFKGGLLGAETMAVVSRISSARALVPGLGSPASWGITLSLSRPRL